MREEVSVVELLVARCAGLDVAKDEVVACVRVPDGRGGRVQEVRTFPTFTSGLEALADWLAAEGVTQVVMEATGQYWKPVWYVLEERGLELLLVNARHDQDPARPQDTLYVKLRRQPLPPRPAVGRLRA
jgi:transposase